MCTAALRWPACRMCMSRVHESTAGWTGEAELADFAPGNAEEGVGGSASVRPWPCCGCGTRCTRWPRHQHPRRAQDGRAPRRDVRWVLSQHSNTSQAILVIVWKVCAVARCPRQSAARVKKCASLDVQRPNDARTWARASPASGNSSPAVLAGTRSQ